MMQVDDEAGGVGTDAGRLFSVGCCLCGGCHGGILGSATLWESPRRSCVQPHPHPLPPCPPTSHQPQWLREGPLLPVSHGTHAFVLEATLSC